MSRTLVLAVLLSCAVFMAGCHTVAGAAAGAATGAGAGAKKDYQEINKADIWVQKNLW